MSLPAVRPFFLDSSEGRRFSLFHAPRSDVTARGGVLAVHAFAEEMNKTRRVAADAARALAAGGFAVLQIDLFGCGDSDGDFGDATWNIWQDDLALAWRWLASRCTEPLWLWGMRGGALLAADFAKRCDPSCSGLLFWQPVASGAQHLGQFLRLKTVNALLRDGAAPSNASPRAELAAGHAVEIAGYRLNPTLAMDLERAQLKEAPRTKCVRWFEVSSLTPPSVSPVATRIADGWKASGVDVRPITVHGPAFWQTQEVERCDSLVAATLSALCAP